MRGVPIRGRGKAARATSERALLDAFEGLLQRHGPEGIGVNAVLDSARVGKQLLYRYFGDLEGLARAWSRERRDPLALGRRAPRLRAAVARRSVPERIALLMQDYATQLRAHPWAAQVLLAELSQPATLGDAMREIRREIGAGHEALLLEAGAFDDAQDVQLSLVLHAAAIYLALRARFAPDYNGLDLRSRAGWDAAMRTLGAVAELSGRRPRRPRGAVRRARKASASR